MKTDWAWVFFIVCVIFALYISDARADESVWGTITIRSYHSNREPHYHESNPGLGVEVPVAKDTRLVTGFYDNSFNHETIYAGASYTPLSAGNFHFGGVGAFVSGYQHSIALGAFVIEYEKNNYGANVLFVPKISDKFNTSVVALQLKFHF
jgi:hypothetical protein